jgi:hypothetical protein
MGKNNKKRRKSSDTQEDQVVKDSDATTTLTPSLSPPVSSSLMDSIFGRENDVVVSYSGNSLNTAALFAQTQTSPKTRKKISQSNSQLTSSSSSSKQHMDEKRQRLQSSPRDILQQRRRQSQHPLIQSSLDFPGVFERETDVLENLPWEEQVMEMAQAVQQHGLCIIRNTIKTSILEKISQQARVLQSQVCEALDQRNIQWNVSDTQQHQGQTFRFHEAASRCKGRMDVALEMGDNKPRLLSGNNLENPISLASFYSDMEIQQNIIHCPKVYPVIQQLLGATRCDNDTNPVKLVYAGLIFNLPQSQDQPWHQDGVALFPDDVNAAAIQASVPPYALNVFIPLETKDAAIERGPTEFLPGSHRWSARQLEQVNGNSETNDLDDTSNVVSPILKQGDVLIYDYRVCHRGTSNLVKCNSADHDSIKQGTRKILYLMYARPWFTDHVNFDYTQSAESLWSR